jgi:hypothetical protein
MFVKNNRNITFIQKLQDVRGEIGSQAEQHVNCAVQPLSLYNMEPVTERRWRQGKLTRPSPLTVSHGGEK